MSATTSAVATVRARRSNIAIIKIVATRSPQLDLALRNAPRWGGKRTGAGRKPTGTAGLRHASRDRLPRPLPVHVTLRVREGVPSLRTVPIVHAIERTFGRGCVRPGFRLAEYSLQGNHAHLVVEACDRDALGRGMKSVAARFARAVNRVARRSGRVLVDRYHARLLRTPREVHRALRYVLLNARRHAASTSSACGSTRPLLDPASSARWFDGWRRELSAEARRAPLGLSATPVVARARTWLLKIGWRVHGLLDPSDVPGRPGS